jgi:hypothetical protein
VISCEYLNELIELTVRTFWARQASTFVLAFLIGSIFYSAPQTTGGLVSSECELD